MLRNYGNITNNSPPCPASPWTSKATGSFGSAGRTGVSPDRPEASSGLCCWLVHMWNCNGILWYLHIFTGYLTLCNEYMRGFWWQDVLWLLLAWRFPAFRKNNIPIIILTRSGKPSRLWSLKKKTASLISSWCSDFWLVPGPPTITYGDILVRSLPYFLREISWDNHQ